MVVWNFPDHTMLRLLLSIALSCLLWTSCHAVALLDFDTDIIDPYTSREPVLPYAGNHNGFRFAGASYLMRACDTPNYSYGIYKRSGYCNGTQSPSNVLFGAYAGNYSFNRSNNGLFSIYGLFITPAWNDNLKITIRGFRAGAVIYSVNYTLPSPWHPLYTNLNFIAIDRIEISSGGGTTNLDVLGMGEHVAFDNIEYAISVCPTNLTQYNNTSPVALGSEIYFTYAQLDNCWGRVTSTALAADTGDIAAANTWDGSCTLTGNATSPACTVSHVTPAIQMSPTAENQAPNARQLIVNDTKLGPVPFRTSSFSGDLTPTEEILLDYLRGTSSPGLRTRTSVLGDVINSSPVAVGAPDQNHESELRDALNGNRFSEQAKLYRDFKLNKAGRPGTVYVGANDGFLHAFRAGLPVGKNTLSTPAIPNDGAEILGYMPRTVWSNLRNNGNSIYLTLDYKNTYYGHMFYVDAPPAVGDVFYGGGWHTLLATGLGAGGPVDPKAPTKGQWIVTREHETAYGSLSLLDITSPERFREDMPNLVFNEWSIQNPLQCFDESQSRTLVSCMPNFGAVYGQPAIVRLHNGEFGVIVGNGLYSQNGKAGIVVIRINAANGETTAYFLYAGPSSVTGQKNGIVYVTPTDLDDDGVVDYVYAGDVQGNVWRFDLTSSLPLAWGHAHKVFSTPNRQPITTSVIATPITENNITRMMIGFGTGRVYPLESPDGPLYVRGQQSLYGIWDWNLQAWNTMRGKHFATLPQLPASAKLQSQSVVSITSISGVDYRTTTHHSVCWVGQNPSNGCTDHNHYGWAFDLPSTTIQANEQVVSSPVLYQGQLVVNTIVPAQNDGYTMALDLGTGKPAPTRFFKAAGDTQHIGGVNLKAISGSPLIRQPASGGLSNLYFKRNDQTPQQIKLGQLHVVKVKRHTKLQLR